MVVNNFVCFWSNFVGWLASHIIFLVKLTVQNIIRYSVIQEVCIFSVKSNICWYRNKYWKFCFKACA